MFGFGFVKFQPSEYVLKYRNGKIVQEGAGISFYYYAPLTSIVVVPVGSMDAPFIFEEVTADFQTVTIQGQLTYRIVDYKKIAQLLNYTLDMKKMSYTSDDPQKLSQRVINIVRVLTKKHLEGLQLKEAVKSSEVLAKGILNEIRQNEEIDLLGMEILGLSILAILPNKETARALEAQAREQILKKADEAIYERRNASIEQERWVKENEYNTEIAVENKKKQVRETQLEAERTVQQKQNLLQEEQLDFNIALENKKIQLIEQAVQNSKAEADAKAYELSAIIKSVLTGATNIISDILDRPPKVQPELKLDWNIDYLLFSVREPFTSKTSQANIVFGKISQDHPLWILSQMPENGVIFSDGIENDYIQFNSGIEATITVAEKKGHLMV